MFLNYLPSGMSEVVGITIVFAFLVGVILAAMFTADKGNTKDLYTKTTRWLINNSLQIYLCFSNLI